MYEGYALGIAICLAAQRCKSTTNAPRLAACAVCRLSVHNHAPAVAFAMLNVAALRGGHTLTRLVLDLFAVVKVKREDLLHATFCCLFGRREVFCVQLR